MKTEINQNVKYTSLSKGFGITGLVLGILTLLISFIPCFGLFAIIFGIIAIMVSLIGLVIALKHNHEKGLIIGALICSLLGCGIAYSQYAAINSITNEIVKETNKMIDENNKESSKENKPSLKNNDVALVLEYIEKSKKDTTDKDGLPLNYEYEIKWGKSKKLGKTDVYSNKGEYRNSLFLELFVSEINIILSLNGKQTKTVKLISHVYELNELNPYGSNPIPTEFIKKEFTFTPALDDISVQKEIIQKVTEPKFYQSLLKKTDHDNKVSNDWINATSELIKSSNILNIKTLKDFEKVESITEAIVENNTETKKEEVPNVEVGVKKIMITVDNLRVRTSPDLDADKIENLSINSVVEFLDKKSETKTTVTIKGEEINEYWYKIKTPSGNIGWIHGCCFEKQ